MYGQTQTWNLLKELKKKNLDSLLLINNSMPHLDPSFQYFTGISNLETSVAIIKKAPTAFVPEFELNRAKKESWVKDLRKMPSKKFWKTLSEELKGKKVGINSRFLPLRTYNKLKRYKIRMTDISEVLSNMRMVKTKEEILYLKKAINVTKSILRKVDTTKTENEITAQVMYEFSLKKMKAAYDPIVAYDLDSTTPHFTAGSRKGGKVLLIDVGANYKGYNADLTRTFVLDKKDMGLKKLYNTVKKAQRLAINAVKLGVLAKDVDAAARDYLKSKGYDCPHSIGHGIGLNIHERPNIGPGSKQVLKEGMIFTVEPGVYIKGKFGVRIEDDVLVTKKGCDVL